MRTKTEATRPRRLRCVTAPPDAGSLAWLLLMVERGCKQRANALRSPDGRKGAGVPHPRLARGRRRRHAGGAGGREGARLTGLSPASPRRGDVARADRRRTLG